MNNNINELRLLYITLEYGKHVVGGVGRVINGLASNMGNLAKLSIFYFKFNVLRNDSDIYLYHLANGSCDMHKYVCSYKKVLKKLLSTEKYDVVHLMYPIGVMYDCLNIIKEYCPGAKFIYSCHNIAKYEKDIRMSSARHIMAEENIVKNVDHIHFLNKSSLQYFNEAYPGILNRTSNSIIPNGIDEKDFSSTDEKWIRRLQKKTGKELITISCLSRWSYGKGLEYLLEAVPKVIKYNKNIRFIIAGRKLISWENGYHRYSRLINKKFKAVKEFVLLLGWLNNIQRNSIYSITDIYIMPSLLEYYPYSILEPIINQVPIISSRIDPVTEILNENEDCLLYEPTNADELAEKILYLSKLPELRDKLKNNAYEKVKNNNKWKTVVQAYINMYKTVL